MRVSAGSALGYATMPGIFPRLKDILFSGFGPVTQLIAIICFMGGLLPKNHLCFSKDKKAANSLTRILADAASGIEFKWKNIDKIIIFAMIVCGTVMMWLYVAAAVIFFLTSPSLASGFAAMVQTVAPTNDIAFMMLDKVFGIPGVYNSSVSLVAPFPSPFQMALHELFRFYSVAIFVIAIIIFLYHVINWVLDITQTGKVAEHLSDDAGDGGKGFSWLPIRFVCCFGLLIPFGMGLNSGQWITLYTAKYGSGLATNAWLIYNLSMGDNPVGDGNDKLIANPTIQDSSGLIKSLLMMRSCYSINGWGAIVSNEKNVAGYLVNGAVNRPLFDNSSVAGFMTDTTSYNADPINIASGSVADDFIEMLDFSGYSDIKLVIGSFDPANPDLYKEYPGKILPVCGSLTVPVTGRTGEALYAAEGYLFATMNVLFDVNRPSIVLSPEEEQLFPALTREYMRTSSQTKNWLRMQYGATVPAIILDSYVCGDVAMLGPCDQPVEASYWKLMMDELYEYAFASTQFSAYDFLANTDTAINFDPDEIYIFDTPTSYSVVGAANPLLMTAGIKDYGWGGAGLWYNKIGERNGSLYSAVAAIPSIDKFPLVMEEIREQRAKTDTQIDSEFCEKFNPRKSGTSSIDMSSTQNQFNTEQATALYNFCVQLYENAGLSMVAITRTTLSSNPIEKAIHMFFSEFMIYNRTMNTEVTPMAQLTSVGRVLIDKAILGVTASALSYAVGGAAHVTAGDNKSAEAFAQGAGMVGKATMGIALMGLSSGFVLYYMLPIMPFIYFFFAVGRWVKVIFEAMVGMPLWALAHLRVGGPGLPGSAAINGYFLILEIFIRPILTVFSLIASFAIFSALTIGLNSVFTLVSSNLFGSPAPILMGAMSPGMLNAAVEMTRGMVDQFFLSIFYIFLVYTIGIGSFKLIDIIPDNIMRWSGAGVQSFAASDVSDDMIEQWQWELPQRFNSATGTIGSATQAMFYEPGKNAGDAKRAQIAQEKRKAAAEAEAARANQAGGEPPS